MNRPGGNGTIALDQLIAAPGDGHVLMIATSNLLGNHITGFTRHSHVDFTPLALMLEDYFGVNVRDRGLHARAGARSARRRYRPSARKR